MLFLSLLGLSLFAGAETKTETATPLKFLSQQTFPSDFKFEKSRVGGLSGVVWDSTENIFWAVSDDRGSQGEPRLYGFQFSETPKLELKVTKLVYLKDPKNLFHVFDFEGISLLPWGNFLISSEGDMNKKPRVQPGLFEFKKTGALVRSIDVPDEYLAESSGRQTKGVRNNFAFEGLTAGDGGFYVATELPLVQDKGSFARILKFDQPGAFQVKAGAEWLYPISEGQLLVSGAGGPSEARGLGGRKGKDFNIAITGVSEIHSVRNHVLWVLERTAGLSLSGLGLSSELYEVQIPDEVQKPGMPKTNTPKELTKKKIFDFDDVVTANFEAMALGPKLKNGKQLLVVISDNNFQGSIPTRILFFEVVP